MIYLNLNQCDVYPVPPTSSIALVVLCSQIIEIAILTLGGCRVYPFEATNPQERIEQLRCPRRGEGHDCMDAGGRATHGAVAEDARNKIRGSESNEFIGQGEQCHMDVAFTDQRME